MRYRLIGSCALALASLAARAHAHDPGMSVVTISEHGDELALLLVAADMDLPAHRRAGSAACDAGGVLQLWIGSQPVELRASCSIAEPGHTAFEGRIALARSGQLAIAVPLLRELARGHETFVRLLDAAGQPRAQRMLTSPDRQALASVTAPPVASAETNWLWRTLAAAVLALLVLALDALRRRGFRTVLAGRR
jgi:hypothetical protein